MFKKDIDLFKLIDNTEYNIQRENLYKKKKDIDNQIKNLNKELKKIEKDIDTSFNVSMEIGFDVTPDNSVKDLKINDEVIFISYNNGYGIYKGIYERNDGYASMKDIKMIYHPKNIDCCSYRVSFKDIVKIIEK